ncbi:MAG: helix-turn-helix domain-containing protein [Polaribacter sp.]
MNTNDTYIISWIGKKIRDIRFSKNWSLTEMAERSGISIAMLSKIENSRVYPTFPTLIQILKILQVDLNLFFDAVTEEPTFPGFIVLKKENYKITDKEEATGFQYKNIISRNLQDLSLEISLLTLSKSAKRKPVSTEGFEFLYLLKGEIDFTLDNKIIKLTEGDALYFDGRIPHVPVNCLEEESILLILYLITN